MSFFIRARTVFLISIFFISLHGKASSETLCEDIFSTSSIASTTWKIRSLNGVIIDTFEHQGSEYHILMTNLGYEVIHRRSLKPVATFFPQQLFQHQQHGGSIHADFKDGVLTWKFISPFRSQESSSKSPQEKTYLTQMASYFFDPQNGLSLKESTETVSADSINSFQKTETNTPLFQFHSQISDQDPYHFYQQIQLSQNQYLVEADSSQNKLYIHSAQRGSNGFEFASMKQLDFSSLPWKIYANWNGFDLPNYSSGFTPSELHVLMKSSQGKNIFAILSVHFPTVTMNISEPIKLPSTFSVDSLMVFEDEIHLRGYEKQNKTWTMTTKILTLKSKLKTSF